LPGKKSKRVKSGARGELVVNEKQGTLSAYGERFLLIPVKLIHSIEDRLTESFGPITATSLQYEIGKEGGAQYVHLAQKVGIGTKSPSDVQRIASRLGTHNGWGKVEIVDFDFNKKIARIRWKNGVSVRNRKGKTPVCHFGRGVLTGAVEEIFGRRCESIEISCQGKGDSFCEAVVAEPTEISRLVETRPVNLLRR
jgi:predicted hydrocarbon binding protein